MSRDLSFGSNRTDFATRMRSAKLSTLRWIDLTVLGMFAGLVLIYSGVIDGGGGGRHQLGWVSWIGIAIGGASLGGLFVALMLTERRFHLCCPQCAADVRGIRDADSVIAVGRCPRCEVAIWDDREIPVELATAEEAVKLPRWETMAAQFAAVRPRWKPLVVALGVGIGLTLLFNWGEPTLAHHWQATFGSQTLPFLKPLIAFPLVVLTGIGFLRVYRDQVGQLPRCPQPQCGVTLGNRDLIHATGRCSCCGEWCLADPLPRLETPTSEQTFVRSTLIARLACWRRYAGVECLVGGIAAGAWFGLCWVYLPIRDPVGGWGVAVWMLAFPIQLGATLGTGMYRARGLNCPECENSLTASPWLVLSTNNCPGCGCRIVRDGPA